MMDFEDELSTYKPSKIFFLDTNLNSPILITEIMSTKFLFEKAIKSNSSSFFYALTSNEKYEIRQFRRVCKSIKITAIDLETSVQLQPEMYGELEKEILLSFQSDDESYEEALTLVKMLEDSISAGLINRGLPINEICGTSSKLKNEKFYRYRRAYAEFTDFFSRAEHNVKNSECYWTVHNFGVIKIVLNSKNAFLVWNNKIYYSSLNQILMVKDKIATRFMLLEHVEPLGLNTELIETLFSLFKWQDDTLSLYGNNAYNLLKATEPLFKTRISHVVDNVFGTDTAYSRMIQKMDEKESKMLSLNGNKEHQIHKLCKIVESVQEIRSLVEMFGCLKSCGHPLIDAALGGLSAAEEARSPDETNLSDAQRLRNTFCHTILVSYVKQKGIWPKLFYLKPNLSLKRLNDVQERHITYVSYDLSDWTFTEWTKILDFDYFPNFLELMDDKAISFYKSDKHLTWCKERKPISQRRLLLELMQRPKLLIRDIIDRVSRRDIPDDWFIVSLYPKEREFKVEPRMFSMLVLEMRCFFTCIEANLADKLFKYLPQQTMTKTKTQNQERFLNFTDPKRDLYNYTLFLEIDLTRWNLRWRELVIHMLGHDINNMFGMKGTFTVTHWFFSLCQIVVRVQGCKPNGIELPKPPLSDLAWTGHLGGFEGLNQKLWTAATYAMVEMGLMPLITEGTINSYELIGQGDNQVVRVSIPSKDQPREDLIPSVRDRINIALEEACKSVNQIVKPEENIESTSVLTYSKDVFVEGVEYATSLKKHSRLFPVTSLDFPSVTSNIRSIIAGSVAGAENSLYPLRSALIGLYHSARYLISASKGNSIHGKAFPKLNTTELISALLIPSSVGGLAGMNITAYMYKGGSDPLGKEISGLRFLSEASNLLSNIVSKSLRALEEKYFISPNPDLKTLIDNPYGLPLDKKISPLSQVGDLTLKAFRNQVRNEDINPLLSANISTTEETLKEDLIAITPLNPLLLHDLYEASGFGTIKLMKKMFVNTRTVQSVSQWVDPTITHNFLRSDLNEVINFKLWAKGLPDRGYSGVDSYELCRLSRSYWGVELHGVTTYQPLDFTHQHGTTRSLSSIKWSAHSDTNLLHTRGPLSGYLGTATRQKRSEHGYKLVDTGAPSRSVMKLQLIKSQAYGDKNFNDLLEKITLTRCNISLSSITDLLPKVVGGSISHRYASVMRSMSASYVGPLNFVTHIRIDTDRLGDISGSALNYPIMLQEFIVMAQYGAKLHHLHNASQQGELIFNPNNLNSLPDDSLHCNKTKFIVSDFPKSPLLFSEEIYFMRTYDSVASYVPKESLVSPTDYTTLTCVKDATFGFFVATLRDQNRAKQIADTKGHASIPSRYQIDIPEANAIGPKTILEEIAQAVIYTTFRDTFRTVQIYPNRWDEALFMTFNIKACVKSVSRYWYHPLFKSHKESKSFRGSDLKYAGSSNLITKLESWVRRLLYNILNNPNHVFWIRQIPIFAGENQTQFSESLMTLGARELLLLRLKNHPDYTELANEYVGYMMLPKKISLDSEAILDFIRGRYGLFSSVVKKRGDGLLANELDKIRNFKYNRIYNDDIATVIRGARSLKVAPRVRMKPQLAKQIDYTMSSYDHCENCYPDSKPFLDSLWSRYRYRRNGGLVSSGYTWLPLISVFNLSKQVAIIGSGNGGLADLLITCFNVNIIALDLEIDMPQSCASLIDYHPVGLRRRNYSRYLQSDLSLITSGDWNDKSIRKSFLDNLPGISSLFIDITEKDFQNDEILQETLKHENICEIYSRIVSTKTSILRLYNHLSLLYHSRLWVLSHGDNESEAIIYLSAKKRIQHKCSFSCCLSDNLIPEPYHSLIPKRHADLLQTATCNQLSWDGQSLVKCKIDMENLCLSLLNKPDHMKLRYIDRINMIVGYATIVLALEDDPRSILKDWNDQGFLETNLHKLTLKPHILTHLVKYSARLSSSLFDSYVFSS
ncbi:RNA-dependent RNA polymerase [Erysiphe necator associated negative-stranded RNA virus 5]|uniref:RNA-dependent RNA polymerase n=1 Tax=Erysiphe necator associated negative-stranded RNA virus 5 TaxID=2737072 RepID=UPI002481A09F|nr:RNA-dependent RNA polymerase [Erysiphe necator associated negative-stranded RNA virus 5]QJW70344.1 RNA-dependent RNA polymerase [Erysiphe necator associated negative-stranded RNA virus 5]